MNQPKLHTNEKGDMFWFLNGTYHREDGPAIICRDGYTCYKIKGLFHRVDGPAIIYSDGTESWFLNGLLHRVNGPAIEKSNRYKAWYLNGIQYSYENWFQKLTPEQQYNYLWNLNE
jgi:hypothetical protein